MERQYYKIKDYLVDRCTVTKIEQTKRNLQSWCKVLPTVLLQLPSAYTSKGLCSLSSYIPKLRNDHVVLSSIFLELSQHKYHELKNNLLTEFHKL